MSGRVVVLGSLNVDLTVQVGRLPRAGETVFGSSLTRAHGGKGANQAVAAARVGADVVLCGAVGSDVYGTEALEALADERVNVDLVARVAAPTGTAIVLVDEAGENEIVVVPGANLSARGTGVSWRAGDVAAAVLEVPAEAVRAFFVEARSAGARTVLNASPAASAAKGLLPLVDVVCVNENELESLGHAPGAHPLDGAALVTTLGARGVRLVNGDGVFSVPAHSVPVLDTVGAGDAVCGVLAASLAEGRLLRDSVMRANAAGAMTVRTAGARSSPTGAELDEFLRQRPSERERLNR